MLGRAARAGVGATARSGPCTDRAQPVAKLTRSGVRVRRQRLRIRGRCSDAGCGGKPGKVVRVEIAIGRKAGRRRRFLRANGRLSTRRRCTKPAFLRANGTTHWTLTSRRRVLPGRFLVTVRVTDAAGNRSRPKRLSLRLR